MHVAHNTALQNILLVITDISEIVLIKFLQWYVIWFEKFKAKVNCHASYAYLKF